MPKPGPRTTTRYSDEFKATAVRLSALPAGDFKRPSGARPVQSAATSHALAVNMPIVPCRYPLFA